MHAVFVEMICPNHGLERFKIKVIRKYSIKKKEIIFKFRSKPTREISCVIIGREVNKREVRNQVQEYFRQRGLWEHIIFFKII